MAFIIIFKNWYFQIIIKKLTKCNILNTFALKIMENLPTIILKKLRPWPRKSLCSRKVGPWPKSRIFLSPWPRRLCLRLHL